MKRRRFLAVSVGTLVLGGLLLASGGPGVTPAGAQKPTPQQQQFQQILDKLDQILAATKDGGGAVEDNHTLRWDQALPVAQRFVILQAFNSDAVLDNETGLVWEKSPQTTIARWSAARRICTEKVVGGQKGWRLPSLTEIRSLVDSSVAPPGPTLPPGHPFLAVQSAVYWSETRVGENPSGAWAVHFGLGGGSVFINWAHGVQVWCVH